MLANISGGDFWGLVLSSALVASIVSGLFSVGVAKANRRYQSTVRKEESEAAVAQRFLPIARDVHDWIWRDYGERFGPDVGFHGINAQVPRLASVAQVLSALDELRFEHPNEDIRVQAERLQTRMDSIFNMVDGPEVDHPTLEEEIQWTNLARDLMEWIRDGLPANSVNRE
jgi:MoxR-like ATPase